MSGSQKRVLTLLALPVAVVSLLFAAPLAVLVSESVVGDRARGGGISFDQYARFFGDSFYTGSLLLTFGTALLVAVLAIAIGYPVAYLYWRSGRRARSIMLVLLLSPFYANVVVKVFGWMVVLSPGGLLNELLLALRLVSAPIDFLNGYGAIVLVEVHRCLPFVVLLVAAALSGIDEAVLQSARVCGASGARVFRAVVVPLSMPGVVASGIVAFSLTSAGFVVPRLVGGSIGGRFAPVLMYQQMVVTQNWRFGAAIGVVLLTGSLVTLALGTWLARRARAGRVLSDAFVQ